ncbi:hypothetical protein GJ744_009401 [Endocarpon pusillum]|uniref:Uncharacterized protein n=1 Tax=Endocarpon pusillum TaxID=364733 RepID=A0A8H7E662_9EURO|nr:hypothetical protein GJ744_009401 [Endocarpon pusillum]
MYALDGDARGDRARDDIESKKELKVSWMCNTTWGAGQVYHAAEDDQERSSAGSNNDHGSTEVS